MQVRHCYGRQRADGCVIFGGDRVTTHGADYTVDQEALLVLSKTNHCSVLLEPA